MVIVIVLLILGHGFVYGDGDNDIGYDNILLFNKVNMLLLVMIMMSRIIIVALL